MKDTLAVNAFARFDILTSVTINMEYGAMQSGTKSPNVGKVRCIHLPGRTATFVSISNIRN